MMADTKDDKGSGKSKSKRNISISLGSGSTSSSSTPNAAGMGLYILLLLLAGAAFFVKGFIGFPKSISIVISLVVGFIFFVAVKSTPEKSFGIWVVVLAIIVDLLPFFKLGIIPDAMQSVILNLHIFVWVILALSLFILGVIDNLKQQKPLGWPAKILLVIFLSIIFFLLMSLVAGTDAFADTYQDQAFQEYKETTEKGIQQVQKGYEETKNTFGDLITCGIVLSNYGDSSSGECLEEKKAQRYCKEKFKDDEILQKECIKTRTQGNIPLTVKKTSRKEPIKVELDFDKAWYKGSFLGNQEFPIRITYKNPTDADIGMTAVCQFKGKKETITGTISPEQLIIPKRDGRVEEESDTFECTTSEELEGKYDLIFNVTLHGMKTDATLTRFFIKERTRPILERILESEASRASKDDSLVRMEEKLTSKFGSADVPKDYVTLGIGLGQGSTSNTVIAGTEKLKLIFYAENKGKGKLLRLSQFTSNMESFGAPCSSGGDIDISSKKLKTDVVQFASCGVSNLPYHLEEPEEDYIESKIEGTLLYDYELHAKKAITVFQDE